MIVRRTSAGTGPARLAETTATSLAAASSTTMYPPRVPDDEYRPTERPRTWGGLAAATVMPVAILVAVWIASNPLAGAVVLGTLALLVAAASLRRGRPAATTGRRETARSARPEVDSQTGDGPLDARSSAMPVRPRRGSD